MSQAPIGVFDSGVGGLSVLREIRSEATDYAESHAIEVFSENLKNLLMQPPLKGSRVLGMDPRHSRDALMREVCPDYLQHFVAYTDALSWLEQLGGGTGSTEVAVHAGSGGEDVDIIGRQLQRLLQALLGVAVLGLLGGHVGSTDLQVGVLRVTLHQRLEQLQGLGGIAVGAVHARQRRNRQRVLRTLRQCRRQGVVSGGQLTAQAQLLGLAHAVVEQQVVVLLALLHRHAAALQVAQNGGHLSVLLGAQQHAGVAEGQRQVVARTARQQVAHDDHGTLRVVGIGIGRSHAGQARRLALGQRFDATEEGTRLGAPTAAIEALDFLHLQVEIHFGHQPADVRIARVARDAREGRLGLAPVAQLHGQQRAGVERVAVVRLGLQQTIDQAARLVHGAQIDIQTGQGKACPGIARIVAQGVFQLAAHAGAVAALFG